MKLVTQIRVLQEGFLTSRCRLLSLSPGDTLHVQYHNHDQGCDISAEEARRMVLAGMAEVTECQPLTAQDHPPLTMIDFENNFEEASHV